MSPFVLFAFLAALLVANIILVIRHRHSVWEQRRRHIMSLHRIDTYIKAVTVEPETSRIVNFINEEVKQA